MTTNGRNGGGTPGDAERDPRLDRLYRETAREEPPARLDAAILAAARREVGARPHAVSARLRAWRVPVSIAAVVVLSMSLVMLVREEGGGKLEQPPAMDLYSRSAESAPAPPAAVLPAAPEAAKAPARAAPPAAVSAARDDVAPGATASARVVGEAARREDQARAGQPAAPELPAARPSAAAPSPQPFQAAPERRPALAADQAVGAGTTAQSAGARGDAVSSVAPAETAVASRSAARMMQRDRSSTGDLVGSPSAVLPPPAAPAEKPLAKLESRAAQSGPVLAESARVAALVKEFEPQPPEKWLEKIEALRREGRKGEADELLAEFRRRFPNHPLPLGLR